MNIENIFKDNHNKFDDEHLPNGFAERFEKRLHETRRHKKTVRLTVYVSSVAASIALLIMATLFINNDTPTSDIANNANIAQNTVNVTPIADTAKRLDSEINEPVSNAKSSHQTTINQPTASKTVTTSIVYDYEPEVKEVINYYQSRLNQLILEVEQEGCVAIEDEVLDTLRMNPIHPQDLHFMPIEKQIAVVVDVYAAKIGAAQRVEMICEDIDY